MRNIPIYLMRKHKRTKQQVSGLRSCKVFLCIFSTLVVLKLSLGSPLTEKAAANLP